MFEDVFTQQTTKAPVATASKGIFDDVFSSPAPAPASNKGTPITQPANTGSASLTTGKPQVEAYSPSTTLPKPPTTPTTPKASYGSSNLTDPYSAKPLLTYENPQAKQSQLLADRTALPFDPTVAQKIDPKILQNGRMPQEVSQAIKSAIPNSIFDELDHMMPLELGGSNLKGNLQLEPAKNPSQHYSPGKNPTATDPLENALAAQAHSGKISLVDAWKLMAKAKGYKLPEEGGPVASGQGSGQMKTSTMNQPLDEKIFNSLGGQAIVHPVQTFKQIVDNAGKNDDATVQNLFTSAAQFVVDARPGTVSSEAKQVASTLNLLHAAASLVLLPVSQTFMVAEHLPVLKAAATATGLIFDKAGQVVSFVADKLLAKLPIDQSSKDALAGPIHDISSLAGQIILGGYVYAKATGILDAKGSISPEDIKTITNDAEVKAKELSTEATKTQSTLQNSIKEPTKVEPETVEVKASIPKELEPLSQEAKKYKTAEEFTSAVTGKYQPPDFFKGEEVARRAERPLPISEIDSAKIINEGYQNLAPESRNKIISALDNTIVKEIKVYRATETGRLLPGDYVALDKTHAEQYLSRSGGKIVEETIPKSSLSFNQKAGDFQYTPNGISSLVEFHNEATKTPKSVSDEIVKPKIDTRAGAIVPDRFIPKSVKEIASEVRGIVSPQFASKEATASADTIRNAKADIANAAAIERLKYKDITKTFGKASDAENIGNISEYERTGQFKNAPEGYSDFYKKSIESSRAILQQTYGEDRVGYVENYVRRAFEFASKDDEVKGTAYLTNKTGSLSANKSNIKGRVLDMPLDEALANMKARGINVKPVTTNPELLRQWSVENANQAIRYKEAWDSAKQNGLIQFVKQGGRTPEGKVALNDRVAKVFFPTDKGMVQTGQYYADKEVARVFNNAVSKGIGASPTIKGIRSINNAYNQFQLGFSAFHAVGTAINASISDLALGARQIMNGDIKVGAISAGKGALPGVSFVKDLIKGKGFIADLVNNDPEAIKTLQEKVNPAGARLRIEQQYTNAAYENMIKAWKDAGAAFKEGNVTMGGNRVLAGAVRIPMAIVQKVASPLMEYAIPRVKMGAFLDLADATLAKLPEDATPEIKARALSEAWDSIDNRFGQLVYDNLFWNKATTDVAQIATRSVGWNLGTVREIGGGLTDLLSKTATGKGISDRTLYTVMLPLYVGTLGAVYQYLHTGQRPSSLKDYFYPKNGLTDKNNNPDRSSLPTYMKDVYAYSTDPKSTIEHKASPIVSFAEELATNRNYYGDMVVNPADPKGKQLEQIGAEALSQLLPFTIQNVRKVLQEKGKGASSVEPFLGITKAPASIIQSDKQKAGNAAITQKRGAFAPRTPEQVQIDNEKADARTASAKGDQSRLDALIKMGIISSKSRAKFIKDSKLTPYQRSLQSLLKSQRAKYTQ